MLSVTSDVAASASYANAPPKPVLPDLSQAAANFAALVDSNTPGDIIGALPPEPPAQPSANDPSPPPSSPASANPPSNQTPPPNDQAGPPPNSNDPPSGSSGGQQNNPGAVKNNDTDNTQALPSGNPKSGSSKAGAKDSHASTDTAGSIDQTGSPQPGTTAATAQTQTLIVGIVPVGANPAPAPGASSHSSQPLAIAAAAIAASASTTAALAPPTQGNTVVLTNIATTQTAADPVTTPKIAGQAAATAVSITPQVAPTDPSATTSATLAVAIEAPASTGAKAASGTKTATVTPAATSTSPTSGGPPATTDATPAIDAQVRSNALAQPATPDQASAGDAAKADASIAASAPPAPSSSRSPDLANAQPAPTAADAGAQAATVLPQQLPLTPAPISVANLTAIPATAAPVPLSGLAVQIAASVQSGKTQFEVRLDPADLGRIDVRIQIDPSGQVTSHLTVERPETLNMLQQDAPQLQQALNDAGLKTGSGGLQFSLRDQSSSSQNSGGQTYNGNAQRLVVSEDNTATATTAGRSYGRMLSASGGVDIMV